MSNKDSFVTVSNADIYREILAVKNEIQTLQKHVIETNGKVKLARWVGTTALTLVLSVVMFLISKG